MKEKIGVLGAGTMGAGIAQVAAQSGHSVVLIDLNAAQLEKAKSNLAKTLSKLIEKGKITDTQKNDIESGIKYSSDINDFAAIILGRTKKFSELTPIISKASICSVTRIVPISEAILDPTFPARIREIIVGENSKIVLDCVM